MTLKFRKKKSGDSLSQFSELKYQTFIPNFKKVVVGEEFCIGMLTNQQEAINWFGKWRESCCHVARQ